MQKITEVAYFTPNVAAMRQFYARLLGQEPVAASADMVIFLLGDTKIFIHKTYEPADGELPPENHTTFATADVDATCATLTAAGLTLEIEPQDYYWGRSAYLRDPDGHLIEITSA